MNFTKDTLPESEMVSAEGRWVKYAGIALIAMIMGPQVS